MAETKLFDSYGRPIQVILGKDASGNPLQFLLDADGKLILSPESSSAEPIVHIERPFAKGNLTSDGVQWSNEKTTSTDDYETVESVTVEPPADGTIIEVEFGLTCAVKSSSTSESVLFKWQARNKDGTWVDLHSEVTYAADASTYKEYTYSGRFKLVANFNAVPFDIQLLIKSGAAGGENAIGKVKNSSYVKVIYSAS